MKVICDVSVSKTPNNWKSQIIKSFLKMRVVEASWEAVAFSGWRGVGGVGEPPAAGPEPWARNRRSGTLRQMDPGRV